MIRSESKMLKEYGAMFVAKNGAVPPGKVVFNNEAEVGCVAKFRSEIKRKRRRNDNYELQTPAMNALK